MKYIKQFGIILFISYIGELLNYFIDLKIPANIYGIIILFLCLKTKIIPLNAVKETGKFLIDIMPILFIPAGVGLIDSWSIIKPSLFSYLFVILFSTVIVMITSGIVTQLILVHKKDGDKRDRQHH